MNHTPIDITRDDNSKRRLLLATALYSTANGARRNLRVEPDRAVIIDAEEIPAGAVTMGSRVEFEDIATGEREKYTITFPDQANVNEERLSILPPIGTALSGCREGDVVKWSPPGRNPRIEDSPGHRSRPRGLTACAVGVRRMTLVMEHRPLTWRSPREPRSIEPMRVPRRIFHGAAGRTGPLDERAHS